MTSLTIQSYEFEGKNNIGKKGQNIILTYLLKQEVTATVIDVSDVPEYRVKDIDILWNKKDGTTIKIEVKTDELMHKTGNVFLETVSNATKNTRGCFLSSEADYFFYYDIAQDILYVMHLNTARQWFELNKHMFKEAETSTRGDDDILYHSFGYPIPVNTVLGIDKTKRVTSIADNEPKKDYIVPEDTRRIKVLITKLDYTDQKGELIARVYGRDEHGQRRNISIYGTRPFFIVPAHEPIPQDSRIVEVTDGWKNLKSQPLRCIYANSPKDIAQRIKCKKCKGTGIVTQEGAAEGTSIVAGAGAGAGTPCDCINGEIEVGLKSKFNETYQADVVYAQVLRIYYNLVGVIEVPDTPDGRCHISQVHQAEAKISPNVAVLDIETIDSLDTEHAPAPIPCLTMYDSASDTFHLFCFGFKKHEVAQVLMRLQQHWMTNLIPKLMKYNYHKPRVEFHVHEAERNMLGDLINTKYRLNPDILATWNRPYDMPYTVKRMENLQLPFSALSENNRVYLNKREGVIEIEGVVEIDLMEQYADMQLQELRSKTLNFCSNKEFGVGKMKRSSIKETMQKDPVGLLAYNIVDVQLTYALMKECQLLDQQLMLTKLAHVGLDNISPLQLVDAFTMFFLKDRKIALPTKKYVKPEPGARKKKKKKENTGGAVHAASVGKHKNIVLLDYKGMYPSLMMSGNMCMSTFITIDEIKQALIGQTVGNTTFARLEDVTQEILEKVCKEFYIRAPNGAFFRKDIQGIIPEILAFLKAERKKYKDLEKAEQDPQKKNVYYLIQYGYKVIMNIFYGMFKNPHFRLMNKDLAEAVTAMGRALAMRTINIIENQCDVVKLVQNTYPDKYQLIEKLKNNNGMVVKYGDSVIKDTIILIKDTSNEIHYKKIEDVFKNVDYSIGDKEYSVCDGIETLSIDKNGKSVWRPVNYVMRHKAGKQIKKISVTNQWNVSVTEDHSLIGYTNKQRTKKDKSQIIEVKPGEIGTKCKSLITLKYIPRANITSKHYPKELYQFMGLFIGNGSYGVKFGEKNYYLYLSNDEEKTKDIIEKVIIPLQKEGYIKNYWIKSNGYDVCINGLSLCKIMDEFRNENGKIIPQWIFKETDKNISHFISGLFDSDGSISKRGDWYIITYTGVNKNLLDNIQKLLWFIGIPSGISKGNTPNTYLGKGSGTYPHRLNIRSNLDFKNKIKYITNKKQQRLNEVHQSQKKKIVSENEFDIAGNLTVENVEYNDYVYDIEVEETHTFFANGFLAHNTDSIFVKLPDSLTPEEMVIVGKALEEYINSLIPGLAKEMFGVEPEKCVIEIEFDDKKIMTEFMQVPSKEDKTRGAKKRYVYFAYDPKKKTIDTEPHFTGMDTIRSDIAPLMAEVQINTAKMLLNDVPFEKIRDYLLDKYNNFNKNAIDSLLIKETFNQDFEEYNAHSPQLIGAMYANKYLSKSFRQGASAYFVYIKNVPTGYPAHVQTTKWGIQPVKTICVNYNEPIPYQFLNCINWEKMRETIIEAPVETLLEAVGYSWGAIKTGHREGKITKIVIHKTLEQAEAEEAAAKAAQSQAPVQIETKPEIKPAIKVEPKSKEPEQKDLNPVQPSQQPIKIKAIPRFMEA